jgi:hypothetical protein
MRFPRLSLLAVALFAASILSAEASFPPVKFTSTRERIAAVCEMLRPHVSLTAWHYERGQYGCVDTDTGNVIICESDGRCTLYYGPRPLLTDLNRRA